MEASSSSCGDGAGSSAASMRLGLRRVGKRSKGTRRWEEEEEGVDGGLVEVRVEAPITTPRARTG